MRPRNLSKLCESEQRTILVSTINAGTARKIGTDQRVGRTSWTPFCRRSLKEKSSLTQTIPRRTRRIADRGQKRRWVRATIFERERPALTPLPFGNIRCISFHATA
jgi:hypothetical protein